MTHIQKHSQTLKVNESLFVSVFFLCVCVCARARERERVREREACSISQDNNLKQVVRYIKPAEFKLELVGLRELRGRIDALTTFSDFDFDLSALKHRRLITLSFSSSRRHGLRRAK